VTLKALAPQTVTLKALAPQPDGPLWSPGPEGDLVERSRHPTALMQTSTVNLLKTLSLTAGIHAEVLRADATRALSGLLRTLVESGAGDKPLPPGCHAHRLVSRDQHRSWSTLGFVRSIALGPQMCGTLSTGAWTGLLVRIVEGHRALGGATLQRQVGARFRPASCGRRPRCCCC